MRLISDLKNKDNILHSILLLAIEKFDKGEFKYIVSEKISRKIFNSVGIRNNNQLMIKGKIKK